MTNTWRDPIEELFRELRQDQKALAQLLENQMQLLCQTLPARGYSFGKGDQQRTWHPSKGLTLGLVIPITFNVTLPGNDKQIVVWPRKFNVGENSYQLQTDDTTYAKILDLLGKDVVALRAIALESLTARKDLAVERSTGLKIKALDELFYEVRRVEGKARATIDRQIDIVTRALPVGVYECKRSGSKWTRERFALTAETDDVGPIQVWPAPSQEGDGSRQARQGLFAADGDELYAFAAAALEQRQAQTERVSARGNMGLGG